jgi:hypothetical protein
MPVSATSLATAHTTQFGSSPQPWRATMGCGPAAAITALRLVDAPGARALTGAGRDALDAVKLLATGDPAVARDESYGLYPAELEPAVTQLGARAQATSSVDEILAAARRGAPTIVAGDARVLPGSPVERAASYVPHTVVLAGRGEAEDSWMVSNPAARAPSVLATDAIVRFLRSVPDGSAPPPDGAASYMALVVSPSPPSPAQPTP